MESLDPGYTLNGRSVTIIFYSYLKPYNVFPLKFPNTVYQKIDRSIP